MCAFCKQHLMEYNKWTIFLVTLLINGTCCWILLGWFLFFCGLQAVMKSYVATSSDPANPEKFLAYMVPAPGEVWIKCNCGFWFETLVIEEKKLWLTLGFIWTLLWQLSKDIYDEDEEVSYSWVREYHWDVCQNFFKIPFAESINKKFPI
jgi:hypothetical protein